MSENLNCNLCEAAMKDDPMVVCGGVNKASGCRENGTLRLWTNGHDVVVASSEGRARFILVRDLGLHPDDVEGDGWRAYPHDKIVTMADHDNEHYANKSLSAREWVALHGEGWLAGFNE